MKTLLKTSLLAASIAFVACNDNDDATPKSSIVFKDHSKTPILLKKAPGFEDITIHSLISSEDALELTPDFVYGSMADGAGLLKNTDGTYAFINNIEADRSVARITLDKTFKPVKGEYILNSTATGGTAQCSGTLITPEEHGFGPLYLSGAEWSGSTKGVFATDPYRDASSAGSGKLLKALGEWAVENAVPLNANAYPGKTVVLIGDDHGDNEKPSGQLAMYVSSSVGDLENGKLYGLKVNMDTASKLASTMEVENKAVKEVSLKEGSTYDVEFVEFTERTLDALDAEAQTKGIMAFNRVEDIDYRRGSGADNREIYFAVTGRKKDALQGVGTIYGRIYKLVLDEKDPLKGKLTCVLDGDKLDGKAKAFHSPDNILVTENYAYIQEDPNGYPDTADKNHRAYLYQYNLKSGELQKVLEIDQDSAIAKEKYVQVDKNWEITGMIDISDTIGEENTFIVIVQAHGWRNDAFDDADKDGLKHSTEGSIAYIVRGLKR